MPTPVAYRYVHRITRQETLTHQPPDRVTNVADYEVTPLYAGRPLNKPVVPDREGIVGLTEGVYHSGIGGD